MCVCTYVRNVTSVMSCHVMYIYIYVYIYIYDAGCTCSYGYYWNVPEHRIPEVEVENGTVRASCRGCTMTIYPRAPV